MFRVDERFRSMRGLRVIKPRRPRGMPRVVQRFRSWEDCALIKAYRSRAVVRVVELPRSGKIPYRLERIVPAVVRVLKRSRDRGGFRLV